MSITETKMNTDTGVAVKKPRASKKVVEAATESKESVVVKKPRASKKKVEEEEVLEEEEVAVKKPRASKKKELVSVVEEEVLEDSVTEVVDTKKKVDRESVMLDFDSIIKANEDEIESLRSGDGKTKGIQFLRSTNSKLKKLQKHVSKIAKGKKQKRTDSSPNSGFKQTVEISPEMRKFAGWADDELHSRNDVTTFICKYVKDKELQFPENRQKIVLDTKLRKLLNVKPGDGNDMVTYAGIQTHIKHHYPKPAASVVGAV
jgi:chromatin remodeling complex protein RSC6